MEFIKERISAFTSDVPGTLRISQDMTMEAKMIKTKGDNIAKTDKGYIQMFIADVTQHIAKLMKVVKMLGKAATEPMDDGSIPKFMDQLDKLKEKQAEVIDWAYTFSCGPDKPQKKKRKIEKK